MIRSVSSVTAILLFAFINITTLPQTVKAQDSNVEKENFTVSLNDENQIYVGQRYRLRYDYQGTDRVPYIKGTDIRYLGGWLVDDPYSNIGRTSKYGISRVKKGNQEIFWLEKILEEKAIERLVVDVLYVSKINKSYIVDGFRCLRNGISDWGIIAIAKLEDTIELREIEKAWHVNRKTWKFEEINTKGVTCKNIRY
jgi:hypothetical protein